MGNVEPVIERKKTKKWQFAKRIVLRRQQISYKIKATFHYKVCIPHDLNLHVRSRCVLLTFNFIFSDNGEID